MSNVNRIILVGQIGREPELKHSAKGNAYCNLSIATNKRSKGADGVVKKETNWHRATVWGKTAEACAKFLTAGSRVYIEGELKMKDWKDKDGNARKTAEIWVDSIQFLGNLKNREGEDTAPMVAPESTFEATPEISMVH